MAKAATGEVIVLNLYYKLWIERLPAREGEQAVSQGSRALRRCHGGVDVTLELPRPALADSALHQVERADDAGQEIVEVMSEPAGELTRAYLDHVSGEEGTKQAASFVDAHGWYASLSTVVS